jgi:molybdopterin/thiamine biosynthesis adenylyltransferase
MSDANKTTLTPEELATYEWQFSVPDFGEAGQRKLKAATALVSRVGGVGGAAALQLAASGIGRLILAHAGNLKPGDLNRQILMTHDWLGKPRVDCAARRLRELNPRIEIVAVPENVTPANAERLVREADIVVDSAPLFEERFAMNSASVSQRKPMVECAVYALEAQLTTFIPGQSPCLRCLCPEAPKTWQRRFPIFGAVAATVGSLAAMEVIKVVAGFGQPLVGRMLVMDLGTMTLRTCQLRRDPDCPECRNAQAHSPV